MAGVAGALACTVVELSLTAADGAEADTAEVFLWEEGEEVEALPVVFLLGLEWLGHGSILCTLSRCLMGAAVPPESR